MTVLVRNRSCSLRGIARLLGPAFLIVPFVSGYAAGPPDLRCGPAQLHFPPGGAAELVVPIENRGLGPSSEASIRLGRRISPGQEWSWSDLALGPLPPGGSRPLKLRLPLAAETGGMSVTLLLDPDGAVPESDESNNRLEIPAVADLVPAPRLEPLPAAVSGGTVTARGLTGPGWTVQCLTGQDVVSAEVRSDGTGLFALSVPLSPGINRLTFRALAAGLWPGETVSPPPVCLDADPPVLQLDEPVEGGIYRAVSPRYTVEDATPAAVEVSLDGRPLEGGTIDEPGVHTLRCTARDAAGNATSILRRFAIDREPPRLELAGLPDAEEKAVRPALTARDANPGSAAFWVDGYLWRNGLAVTAPGRHLLTAAAEDAAGNRSALRITFTVGGNDVAPASPATSAIAAALPAGSRLLLARTGRIGPQSGAGAAVFLADREGRIRLGLAPPGTKPGGAWISPWHYGPAKGLPLLFLHLEDLDADGAMEILAEGPGDQGRRLAILRWQAGIWKAVGEFDGRAFLVLRGPAGIDRPVVLAETDDGGRAWQRTAFPSGTGQQFAPVPLEKGLPDLAAVAADPGWAFLRPLSPGGPRPGNSALGLRRELPGMAIVLAAGPDGYRLLTETGAGQQEQVGAVMEGEIGPPWLWPDPDGLFLTDYDGDGEDEPCILCRQGRSWRELRLYDTAGGRMVMIYRGRVRLAERGYDPGFRLVRRADEVLLFAGPGRAKQDVLRWDGQVRGLVPAPDEPALAEGEINLLGREFMAGADWLPNLW